MATISNTPRPGYVYDSADAVWYPIGTGTHSHSEIASTIVDAKGDLIVATAADTVARLAVGANDTVLTADSTAATGLKWATPATPASGMTLISTTTMSSVAAQNFSSCFTSTYTNYKIVMSNMSSTSNNDFFYLQGLTGTSTVVSAANYNARLLGITSTGSNISDSSASQATISRLSSTAAEGQGITLDLYAPNVGNYVTGTVISGMSTIGGFVGYLSYNASTAFTGFRLTLGFGNITGTVSIYGLAK
jgi:hypothetical protein